MAESAVTNLMNHLSCSTSDGYCTGPDVLSSEAMWGTTQRSYLLAHRSTGWRHNLTRLTLYFAHTAQWGVCLHQTNWREGETKYDFITKYSSCRLRRYDAKAPARVHVVLLLWLTSPWPVMLALNADSDNIMKERWCFLIKVHEVSLARC